MWNTIYSETYFDEMQTISPSRVIVGLLWHINLCRLFNAKSIFMQIVLF